MSDRLASPELRNFRRILAGIDISTLVSELGENYGLWLANTDRQNSIAVQRETNAIFLRVADLRGFPTQNSRDIQGCVTAREAGRFPRLMNFLCRFARARRSELQRAMIVRLKPGGRVYSHTDAGAYYKIRDRYHLVLVSTNGSDMTSGAEHITAREGELWWFNNKLPHASANTSTQWRTHVVFDLLPKTRNSGVRHQVENLAGAWNSAAAMAMRNAGPVITARIGRPDGQRQHKTVPSSSHSSGIVQGDDHMSDGNGDAKKDNGNGDLIGNGYATHQKDNGNGGLVSQSPGNLNHHYSFSISEGNFSLSIQLDFQRPQSAAKPKDNGNGGLMSGPASHTGDNGNGGESKK